jgi:hypothetical protein
MHGGDEKYVWNYGRKSTRLFKYEDNNLKMDPKEMK